MNSTHFCHSYRKIFLLIIVFNIFAYSQGKDTTKSLAIDTSEFKITLSFDKTSYYEGEEIYLNVAIANLTNNPDSLQGLSPGSINKYITVLDRDGDKLPFKEIGTIDQVLSSINFKPGETVIFEVEETLNFGNAETDISEYKSSHGVVRYFEENYYSFQMNFFNSFSNEKIVSNKAYLLVKEAMGYEKSHWEKLLDIDDMADNKDKGKSKKIYAYAKFLKRYPNSAFYDQTFYMYINFRQEANISYNDSIIVDISKYVNKKPNSIYAEKLLTNLFDAIVKFGGGNDKAVQTLKNLVSAHRGTRISKKALEILAQKD